MENIIKVRLKTVDDVKNFNHATSTIESDVLVSIDRYVVDGKSIMGLFSLNLNKDLKVTVIEKQKGDMEQLKDLLKLFNISFNMTL